MWILIYSLLWAFPTKLVHGKKSERYPFRLLRRIQAALKKTRSAFKTVTSLVINAPNFRPRLIRRRPYKKRLIHLLRSVSSSYMSRASWSTWSIMRKSSAMAIFPNTFWSTLKGTCWLCSKWLRMEHDQGWRMFLHQTFKKRKVLKIRRLITTSCEEFNEDIKKDGGKKI